MNFQKYQSSLINFFFVLTVFFHEGKSSSCGGSLQTRVGTLNHHPGDTPGLCIWVINLPVTSKVIRFQLEHMPSSSQLSLYPNEGHYAGQFTVRPIALTSAEQGVLLTTNSSKMVVVWAPTDDFDLNSKTPVTFKWQDVQGHSQDEGQYFDSADGVDYVEGPAGDYVWEKAGAGQQTLLWVLNSQDSEARGNSLELTTTTDFSDCDLIDFCLCSYLGVYQVYDKFLQAVTTDCGRSSVRIFSKLRPALVVLGFVNPKYQTDGNFVSLQWKSESGNETMTTTTETPTTTTTTEMPTTTTTKTPTTTTETPTTTTTTEMPTTTTTKTPTTTTETPTTTTTTEIPTTTTTTETPTTTTTTEMPTTTTTTETPTTTTTAETPSTTTTTEMPATCSSGRPKSCSEIQESSGLSSSKICAIYPFGPDGAAVEALCDFELDGGGWTVIQKRRSGPQDEFYRNWEEYLQGFGAKNGNFWMGLKVLRALTKTLDQEMRVDLWDVESEHVYAHYLNFSVADSSDFFKLSIDGYSGTAGDSMKGNNWMRFSTLDKDNDNSIYSCAGGNSKGGWWYNRCGSSNLNGVYYKDGEIPSPSESGIAWYDWKNSYRSLREVEMKIRNRR